jgi:hypothetical protein
VFLERHYQNAYVTPNLDHALAKLRADFGVGDFLCMDISIPVWTQGGEGVATSRIAVGWVGDLQYELIQPISGPVDVYREAVREAQLLRFHHIAMRVEDWDELRADIGLRGQSIVYSGQTEGLKFLYVDARDTLGHYLEYVWATPEKWRLITRGRATAWPQPALQSRKAVHEGLGEGTDVGFATI